MIFDMTKRVGGGGGLVLLASGTYTKTADSAAISIPVTYTGTPKLFYYYNTTPKASTNQLVFAGRLMEFEQSDVNDIAPTVGMYMAKGVTSSGTVITAAPNAVWPTLSATTMASTRPGSSFTHCAGTWKWYIYGTRD